jgi:hypothetical protein
MTNRIRPISETYRLGRHIEHDERSKKFPAERAAALKSVKFHRHCPPYNQGHLGSCTGNAMAGLLMTEPFWHTGRDLTEADAVRLYSEATHLDGIRGEYPPDDTGSSGLAVAKAAKREGYVTAYHHAFGLDHVLAALSLKPGILGINWYTSFDAPKHDGECPLAGDASVRGGHEVQMFGIEVDRKRVWCYQSWGATWGGLKNGTFWFSFDTLDRLLSEHGDATFPG